MPEPVIVKSNDEPTYRGPTGVLAKILIDGDTADRAKTEKAHGGRGRLALEHITFGPRSSAPRHTRDVDEFIYVVSGATTIHAGGKEWHAEAGDAIYMPPGIEHQHTNPHDQALHQIYIFAPAGPELEVRRWEQVV